MNCVFFNLAIYLSIYLSVYLSINTWTVWLSICQPIDISVYELYYVFTYLFSTYSSVCISVSLTICLYVYLSVCLFICHYKYAYIRLLYLQQQYGLAITIKHFFNSEYVYSNVYFGEFYEYSKRSS